MSFEVSAPAYGRFMGRFSEPLATPFADAAGVTSGRRALDVGCGPGALTEELVRRLGADHVVAVDPSEPFVAAAQSRFPGVAVQQARAESLPFDDADFDLVLAQLVVHFMADPVHGVAEMARVTRPGGTVAACVWDHGSGRGPLSTFWAAVHDVDPAARDESGLAGSREGQLVDLFGATGLDDVRGAVLTVRVGFASFDDWWQPFTLGVGPAGAYLAGADDEGRSAVRDRCAQLLPAGAFHLDAAAWCATGRVG